MQKTNLDLTVCLTKFLSFAKPDIPYELYLNYFPKENEFEVDIMVVNDMRFDVDGQTYAECSGRSEKSFENACYNLLQNFYKKNDFAIKSASELILKMDISGL